MATASPGRGYLLILNVEKNRLGSEFDTNNLKTIFEAMGAEVDVKVDPTGKDVRKIMGEIVKMDFTDYLYVAVAFFSHGTEDDIVLTATDRELINAQKSILIPLCNNPSLDGKLKWLIMQQCRGSYDFAKQKPEGPVPLIKYPKYYAKFFATSPGMKAYRTELGSLFINALCRRLIQEYKDLDIMSIIENVKQDVEEQSNRNPNYPCIQVPEPETNLAGKKFFITSGFKDSVTNS